MNRIAAATLLLLPMLAGAYSTGTTLGGTTTTVNAGAGNQTDPHLDNNLVAYTSFADGASEIRYFNFATSVDLGIPGAPGALDFLSDVSGTTVVFTRIEGAKQSIWSFNTTTAGPGVELAPSATSLRRGASIGGNTVVWQELGFSTGTSVISEVMAYDLVTRASVRVTDDIQIDRDMAVSPNGSVIAWDKCATSSSPCDIYQAVKGATGWTVSQVTATADAETFPDTNGTLVVYGGIRAASATSADIYWKPVAGGAESQLALAGEQRNPNISGNIIAFEGRDIADISPNWDIYLYDLSTSTLYRLTDTPTLSETLNDISVVGTQVRVVWSVLETDQNVYGYTFTIGGGTCTDPDGCEEEEEHSCKPGRGHGHGWGHQRHGRGHGHGHDHHDDDCDDDDDDDGHHDDGDDHDDDNGHRYGHHKAKKPHGHHASQIASGIWALDSDDPQVGCSSSGGGAMVAGLLAVMGVLFLGRRRAAVAVKADRR